MIMSLCTVPRASHTTPRGGSSKKPPWSHSLDLVAPLRKPSSVFPHHHGAAGWNDTAPRSVLHANTNISKHPHNGVDVSPIIPWTKYCCVKILQLGRFEERIGTPCCAPIIDSTRLAKGQTYPHIDPTSPHWKHTDQ